MGRFITVVTFQYPHEAYVIKSKLESEGINVLLHNELIVQAQSFLSNALGGVQLQIDESDLERAKPILSAAGFLDDNAEQPSALAQLFINIATAASNFAQAIKTFFLKVRWILLVMVVVILLVIVLFPTLWSDDRIDTFEGVKPVEDISVNDTENLTSEQEFEIYERPNSNTGSYSSYVTTDPQKAIPYIKKLLEEHPGNKSLERQIGDAYSDVDSLDKALIHWANSIKGVESENLDILFELAQIKVEKKDYDGAIADLLKASQFDWNYNYDLAQVYELKNELKNAEIYYTKYMNTVKKDNSMIVFDENFIALKQRVEEIRERLKMGAN